MDFNSALANLQRTANAVRSGSGGNGQSRDGGGRDDSRRGGGGGSGSVSSDSRGGPRAGGPGSGYQQYHRGGDRDGRGGSGNPRRRPYDSSDNRGGGGPYPPPPRGGGPSDRYGSRERPSQRPRLDGGPGGSGRSQGPQQHRGQRDVLLEPMRRFGYRVEQFRSSHSNARNDNGQLDTGPRHICLLALTIDELPYEHIWRAWADGSVSCDSPVHVSLVCHAKFPNKVGSGFLRQRLLTRKPVIGRGNSFADPEYSTFAPEWGSVQLTRAMLSLLMQGMKIGQPRRTSSGNNPAGGAPDPHDDPRFSPNRHVIRPGPPGEAKEGEEQSSSSKLPNPPPVDAFIFISETCLPVRTLDECVREIFAARGASSSSSWVAARNRRTPGTPRNKYEVDQFGDIHRMVPGQYRWKADQWLLLCREHASAILSVDRHMRPPDQLWNSFVKVSASDEMYFPTVMGVLGVISDDPANDQNVERRQVTYVDWSEGMRNPAAFANGIRDLARVAKLARANRSLFARKFMMVAPGSDQVSGAITVEEWADVLSQQREAEAVQSEQEAAATATTESDAPAQDESAPPGDNTDEATAAETPHTANESAAGGPD
jgi:Core-2/I-Branching enzyme